MKSINFTFIFSILYIATITSQSSVFDIARSGTISEIKDLYAKFPDTIDTSNDAGYTPLILACYNSNNEVAIFIADHCKEINYNNGYGSALMAATVKGNEEMVTKLLELNADPNILGSSGTTALHYAVIFGQESIVRKLVAAGADLNAKDDKNLTPKDHAIRLGNVKIINHLSY